MSMRFSSSVRFILPVAATLACFAAGLAWGPVPLSPGRLAGILLSGPGSEDPLAPIVWASRIPRLIMAFAAGSALAFSGLLMQTLFRNPLAGPSVLGITNGASLATGLLLLGNAWLPSYAVYSGAGLVTAAFLGALSVLGVVLLVSARLQQAASLLLFGILFGHLVSAIESVLQHRSESGALRSFVVWGLGRFSDASLSQSLLVLMVSLLCLLAIVRLAPSLNLLLLGDDYARSMGLPLTRARAWIVGLTGLSAGAVTAFCGPIAFIGLASPHLARMLSGTADHRRLALPTLFIGGCAALASDLLARRLGVPLNAVTSLLGAPVVLAILFRSGKKGLAI